MHNAAIVELAPAAARARRNYACFDVFGDDVLEPYPTGV
jgi:hypothetical protein